MAVYGGVRAQPALLPRRRSARPARSRHRASPARAVTAAILTAFVLGLVYLTQTIHVAAVNHEIDGLYAEQQRLTQQVQSLKGDIARWGAEPAILERAQGAGLDRLGGRLRVAGR